MKRKTAAQPKKPNIFKRASLGAAGLLTLAFGGAAAPQAPAVPAAVSAPATPSAMLTAPRTLSFYNLHTEERLTVTYWRDGSYDQAALDQINHFMRDYRRDEQQSINTRLLDTLYTIRGNLSARYPGADMTFEVISGYRARETTDALRADGQAVARDTSQHQLGNAMDVRIDGVPLTALRDTAWCLQQGGVGYYPETHNNFVHVDVGRVRFWPAQRTRWACMK